MKKRVYVTLPSDVLARIDHVVGSKSSRSAFIEHALRAYLLGRGREEAQARDLERINAAADRLNLEAEDVVSFQAQGGDGRTVTRSRWRSNPPERTASDKCEAAA